MTELTGEQVAIIKVHPIRDALNSLQDQFEQGQGGRDFVLQVITILQGHSAARHLPSQNGKRKLFNDLIQLNSSLDNNETDISFADALVNHVKDGADEEMIWKDVYDLTRQMKPADSTFALPTAPASASTSTIPPTNFGTPVKSSSGRLADREPRDIVEEELFHEIKDCTFRSVGGFRDKFFNSSTWSEEQKRMLELLKAKYDEDKKKWMGFPDTPDETPIWDWLRSLEEHALANAPHKLHTTDNANQFEGRKGQMDLFFQAPGTASQAPGTKFEYSRVLVVGEQKKSYQQNRFKADLLQLTRHVRSVFAEQPTRRFVHAFTFCDSSMELWVFDRSGPYSSGPFDIHNEPDNFARALVGYATMDTDAMGLDTFIEQDGRGSYVTLNDTSGNESTIRLMEQIVRQKAIVCRGTTCFYAGNSPEDQPRYVAKFSWTSDKRKAERNHLELAAERHVQGVARVVAHGQITTIAELRKGLRCKEPHKFRVPSERPLSASTTNTSDRKRKSSSGTTPNMSEPKRRRSGSENPKPTQEVSIAKPSLYIASEDLWENRIYNCLIISPAGRVISDFRTIKELLEAMKDAIRAHQSLYETGQILHRDISSNNIIITKPETAGGFKGMLIDLDLAKVNDSSPSGARRQTGTMQFMAVEVLRNYDHTYRHDLESFFYVLLWMCARQSWNNGLAGARKAPKEKESLLRKWEIGTFEDIARMKEGDMTVGGLGRIMDEFPDALKDVKSLCLEIRSRLFGDTAALTFGTPAGEPNGLYEVIIRAYDDAIRKLESSTQTC